MRITFDIETIPSPTCPMSPEELEAYNVKHPRSRKNAEEVRLETSLNGDFGRIFCIGYAIYMNDFDEVLDEAIIYNPDEVKMLLTWNDVLDRYNFNLDGDVLVGHNIFDFDLPFLYKRAAINKVKPIIKFPMARYRSKPVFDTMREWECWGDKRISLQNLAKALGLDYQHKIDIGGYQIADLFKAGRLNDILEYCAKDVALTDQIYRRMTFE